jgi:hypothetical protein
VVRDNDVVEELDTEESSGRGKSLSDFKVIA